MQAYGIRGESSVIVVPFPFSSNDDSDKNSTYVKWAKHPAIIKLSRVIDLEHNCGYITMINTHGSKPCVDTRQEQDAGPLPCSQSSSRLGNLLEEQNEDDDGSEEEYHLVRATNNPPKNGFNNELCEKIYQEEIENELYNDPVPERKTSVSEIVAGHSAQESQVYDPRQQKLESLRLDLKFGDLSLSGDKATHDSSSSKEPEPNIQFDEWTILDCYFGVPLFDANVNKITCERVLSNGLWDPKR